MTLSFPVSFKIITGNEAQSQDLIPRQNADQGKETQVITEPSFPVHFRFKTQRSIFNQPVPTHSPSWTKNCPRELSSSSSTKYLKYFVFSLFCNF